MVLSTGTSSTRSTRRTWKNRVSPWKIWSQWITAETLTAAAQRIPCHSRSAAHAMVIGPTQRKGPDPAEGRTRAMYRMAAA